MNTGREFSLPLRTVTDDIGAIYIPHETLVDIIDILNTSVVELVELIESE